MKHFTKALSLTIALFMCAGCTGGIAGGRGTSTAELYESTPPLKLTAIKNAGTLDESTPYSNDEADAASIKTASEGAVLLKNDGDALPLVPTDTIAVFGSRQIWEKTYSTYGFYLAGAGSGTVYGTPRMSPIDALKQKAAAGKFNLYEAISNNYKANPTTYVPTADDIAAAKAAGVNKAVYIISRLEGEAGTEESFLGKTGVPDNAIAKGEWYLSSEEETMMKLLHASFDKVIVVTNTGNLMDTSWVKYGINGEQVADSVLFAWYGGLRAPEALASLLSGDTYPSGKLTQTAAKDISDYPSTADFYRAEYTNYTEDIFVGYRYFETFDPNHEKVNYEFGYGLSYTTFDISDIAYTSDTQNITVTARVTNTGDTAGKEVVQVYFSAPQMGVGDARLSKPAKELAGFVKTSELSAGESEVVTVSFAVSDMASYDDTGVTSAPSAWVLEKGSYDVYVGNSVKNVTKAGTYDVPEFTVVEQLESHLGPYKLPQRLLADGTYETLAQRDYPAETYNDPIFDPEYGEPISGNVLIECENYDKNLSSSTISFESSSGGTLCTIPATMKADGTTDFDYASATFNSYSEKNLCWMHVDVRQAVYPVNIAEAGSYKLRIRASSKFAHTDFLGLYINGVKQDVHFNFPKTTSTSYFAFVDAYYPEEQSITLPKGKTIITLENQKIGFPNIDCVEFIRIEEEEEPPAERTILKIEGESYDETLSHASIGSESMNSTAKLYTTPVKAMSDGSISFDCASELAASRYTAYSGINLSKIANTGGYYAVYKVNIEKAGTYNLGMRASRSSVNAINFMKFYVNDVLQEHTYNFPKTGEAGVYFNFADVVYPFPITLPQGEVTLKFENISSFPNTDYFTLTEADPVVSVTVEGEDFANFPDEIAGDEIVSYSKTARGEEFKYGPQLASSYIFTDDTKTVVNYDGSVWADYDVSTGICLSDFNNSGTAVGYSVTVPESGIYELEMTAARPTSPCMDCFDMVVNGKRIQFNVNFPQTAGNEIYFKFITTDFDGEVTIPLVAGDNKVSFILTSANGRFPQLDKFRLTKIADYTPVDEEEPQDDSLSWVKEGDEAAVYDDVVTFEDVRLGIHTLDELVAQMNVEELASFTVRTTSSRSAQGSGVGGKPTTGAKFGIPVADTFDGPTGPTAASGSFGFPSGTCLASSWNIDLAADFGTVVGKYCKKDGGIHFWLAPGINIQRNPLCGRNFEYYSEDPLISGLMASATTEKVQRYGVAVAAKHFAANNKETARGSNDSRVSERALREIYLKGFEMLVKYTKPISLMTAYNKINGCYCSENSELMREIARNEWGFDGMFMTDWGGVVNFKNIIAGENIRMGSEKANDYSSIIGHYRGGNLTRDMLEENAKYVINALVRINIAPAAMADDSLKQSFTHALSGTESVTVEAEEYSRAYKSTTTESREGASGGKNLGSFDKKDSDGNYLSFAEYIVTVDSDTRMNLAIGLSSYAASCKVKISVDGSSTDLQFADGVTQTGDWAAFKTVPLEGVITLAEGTHKIKVTPTFESFNFDTLVFTPMVNNATLSVVTARDYGEDNSYPKYTAAEYGGESGSGMRISIYNDENILVKTILENEAASYVNDGGKTSAVFEMPLNKGKYSVKIEKNGYISEIVSLTLATDDEEVNRTVTLIPGDIKGSFDDFCGDGKVDIEDFIRILRGFDTVGTEFLKHCVDINEDGFVTVEDLSLVKTSFAGGN